ncbi:MAG: hypothetical protein LBV80_11565 [Deltaproteobacteria bacterium]|nr:hypothetical protein [Deltaproteobacteria bacterium]
MKLSISYVKADGSICQTADMQEALENAVPDFYFYSDARRIPWGPFFMSCATTMQEMNTFLEDYYSDYWDELYICPATHALWDAIHDEEQDYLFFKILPTGRTDIDIHAIEEKRKIVKENIVPEFVREMLRESVEIRLDKIKKIEDLNTDAELIAKLGISAEVLADIRERGSCCSLDELYPFENI